MKTLIRTLVLSLAISALAACGAAGKPATQVAQQSLEHVGCKVSQSDMWDSLNHLVEEGESFPKADDVRQALKTTGQLKGLTGPAFDRYVEAFVENYQVTIQGIENKLGPENEGAWKKALAEAEIGIRVTPAHVQLQSEIQPTLAKLAQAEQALGQSCPQDQTDEGNSGSEDGRAPAGEMDPRVPAVDASYNTVWDQLKAQEPAPIYGARKVLATTYQSCGVLSLPAMTAATPAVQGITILPGKHPSGGLLRAIGNLASVDATDYYIKNQTLPKSSCFEVRNSPLIYDFGGKPYTTTSKPMELDFFHNGGSGQAVLGFDCSAFVFSSLAAAGLKMDPSPTKVLKASLVNGINSSAFKEPQSNGLRCLEKISVSKTASIKSGDIVAINGHVVMVDSAGADPFGLSLIKSSSDCNSSKISYRNFNFVIAQSSPSKSGIGVNRYAARDYLAESSTIRNGLTAYAVAACRAKFGLAANLNSPSLSVVRHKDTADCRAPAPLTLAHEDCVDSCRPL